MNTKSNLLTCLFAGSLLAATSMHAATIFTESFESPDTTGLDNADPTGWTGVDITSSTVQNGHIRTADQTGQPEFSTTFGNQAMRSGTSGTAGMSLASAFDYTIVSGDEYTLTFNFAVEDGDGTGGTTNAVAELWAVSKTTLDPIDIDNGNYTVLATQTYGTNTNDMSSTGSLSYTAVAGVGDRLAIAFYTTDFNNPIYFDNVELDAAPVPEPSTAILLGAVGALVFMARRKRV